MLAQRAYKVFREFLPFVFITADGASPHGSLFCRFLSEVTGLPDTELTVKKPAGLVQWSFCLINFLCAAFYEEVLYRFYFIDELLKIDEIRIKITDKLNHNQY